MLTVIDEFSREKLGDRGGAPAYADDVLQVLADLFVECGPPDHIRSDKRPGVRRQGGAFGWAK